MGGRRYLQMRPLHQGAELSCKVMEEAVLESLGVLEVAGHHHCQHPAVTHTVTMVPGLLALATPAITPPQVFPMVKVQARTARWDLGTSARLTIWGGVSSLLDLIIASHIY